MKCNNCGFFIEKKREMNFNPGGRFHENVKSLCL